MEAKTGTLVIAVILILVVMGCGPAAETSPTPATTTKAGPAIAKSAWQVEWEKTLAEARKEGRVAVFGPAHGAITQMMTTVFKKAFPDIDLEYTAIDGSQAIPRLRAERGAGLYVTDVYVGGPGPMITGMKDFALPVEQFLILPEVKDGKYWLGGKLEFGDAEDKLFLVFVSLLRSNISYNTDLIRDPGQFASLWGLARPEWKGKVLFQDPLIGSGPGMSTAHFIYNQADLGPDFLRALAKVEPVLLRDRRLMAEWVARGKYPLLLAPPAVEVQALQNLGAPVNSTEEFKEGTWYSAGSGTVAYLDRAPHPNAAVVFLNWLLTKEAQSAWSKATEDVSRRLDVPNDHLPGYKVPKPGVKYWADFKEQNVKTRQETLKFLKEILIP